MKTSLPPSGHTGLSVEDQARRVLHLLTEAGWPTEAELQLSNPHLCPNCDGSIDKPSSPYCSDACRDRTAFVRQFRAAVASGTILEAEKQIVFGERLWWLLGGGLPMRDSRIPESAKRQVIKRSQGKCEFCGDGMSTIENFGSGCNRPLHLRAVCAACSRTKPFGDLEFIQTPAVVEILNNLRQRVNASSPLRPCDDPVTWDWRAYVARRK
jgi:hypothetical protein